MPHSYLASQVGPSKTRRRSLVRLIFLIYWLAIFEGVLRKYAFPDAGRLLFFVKDPVVVWLYCFALQNRLRPVRSTLLMAALGLMALSIPVVLIQWSLSPGDFSWLIAIYGWRNYFLYLPLAFFVGKHVTLADIHKLARQTLLVSIVVAPLVYIQFLSLPHSPINEGFGQSPDTLFFNNLAVSGTIVRTTGTFTSPVGQACFLGTCMAMLLGTWILPASRRPLNGWRLWMATAAVFSCVALSGSRLTMVLCALVCCGGVVAALASGDRRSAVQRLAQPLALLMVGVAAAPVAFPEAISAFEERWKGAGVTESETFGYDVGIVGRIVFYSRAFTLLLPTTPAFGYQLGIAGNAAFILNMNDRIHTSDPYLVMAMESEWGRNIVELGPMFGLAYIAFRLALIVLIVRSTLAASRRLGDPFPILLCAFASVTLFQGLITGNGAVVAYAWLFSGFCLIGNRIDRSRAFVKHLVSAGPIQSAALDSENKRTERELSFL